MHLHNVDNIEYQCGLKYRWAHSGVNWDKGCENPARNIEWKSVWCLVYLLTGAVRLTTKVAIVNKQVCLGDHLSVSGCNLSLYPEMTGWTCTKNSTLLIYRPFTNHSMLHFKVLSVVWYTSTKVLTSPVISIPKTWQQLCPLPCSSSSSSSSSNDHRYRKWVWWMSYTICNLIIKHTSGHSNLKSNLKLTSTFSQYQGITSIDLIFTSCWCQIVNIIMRSTHEVNMMSRMCLEK